MALKVIIYIASAVYGFLVTYYGMQWLQKYFFQSIKKGKYNPLFSVAYMFVGAVLLFLPALLHQIAPWAFLVSLVVSVITNIILLVTIKQRHQQNSNLEDKR